MRKGTWKVAKVITTIVLTFYCFYVTKAGSIACEMVNYQLWIGNPQRLIIYSLP